jgi:hypothetical protein
MPIIKNCKICFKEFKVPPSTIKVGKGKYCSKSCASKKSPNIFKKGHIINLGKKRGFMEWMLGENNPKWKGDKVGYVPLHAWLYRNLGKPNTCEYCKKTNLIGRNIHWANISGKYKRELSDWIRLCVSCHAIYDERWLKRSRDFLGRFI